MSHDKIKAAARRRMAETGEPYAAARREVIREFQATGNDAPDGGAKRFAISYDGMGPLSRWADTRMGGGPGGGRVEVDADEIRLRMADFKVDVPRASIRGVARSSFQTKGTIGVHSRGDTWLANGSADGLVEITIEPPVYTPRSLSSLLLRRRVNALIVSLVDPDGFIAAARRFLLLSHGATCHRRLRGGAGHVSYAIDRFGNLSTTPPTAPIGVAGVGDRSRLVSLA